MKKQNSKIITILRIIGLLFILFAAICYVLPPKPLNLDDCLELGICASGLELKNNGIPYIMSKEYCINHHYTWDDKISACNVRKLSD
jgi:hypothetical protein